MWLWGYLTFFWLPAKYTTTTQNNNNNNNNNNTKKPSPTNYNKVNKQKQNKEIITNFLPDDYLHFNKYSQRRFIRMHQIRYTK